ARRAGRVHDVPAPPRQPRRVVRVLRRVRHAGHLVERRPQRRAAGSCRSRRIRLTARHRPMEYEQIALDVADNIATITLNRPDQLNAFTGRMMNEMIDAFDQTDANDDVRAVIVTGAGRGFCAGADLSAGGATFDTDAQGAP